MRLNNDPTTALGGSYLDGCGLGLGLAATAGQRGPGAVEVLGGPHKISRGVLHRRRDDVPPQQALKHVVAAAEQASDLGGLEQQLIHRKFSATMVDAPGVFTLLWKELEINSKIDFQWKSEACRGEEGQGVGCPTAARQDRDQLQGAGRHA